MSSPLPHEEEWLIIIYAVQKEKLPLKESSKTKHFVVVCMFFWYTLESRREIGLRGYEGYEKPCNNIFN
jgi:hypothetical protein